MTDAHARAKRLAELAGLTLRDGEVEALGRDLERILGYVGTLAEVDTAGVAPPASPNEDAALLRDDTPERSVTLVVDGPVPELPTDRAMLRRIVEHVLEQPAQSPKSYMHSTLLHAACAARRAW